MTTISDAIGFLRQNKSALVGCSCFVFFLALAGLAPLLYGVDPFKTETVNRLRPPSLNEVRPFGTDNLGRDLFARSLLGSQISLYIAILSMVMGLVAGLPLGLLAGYFKGAVDEFIMRMVDVLLAFPALILALLIVATLGPGINNAILAIGFTEIPVFARLIRGAVLRVTTLEYVEAARALGLGRLRIIIRHVLPNVRTVIIAQATLSIAAAILVEAALSFLGLGAPPPYQSLGGLVREGFPLLERAWWYAVLPGIMVTIAILGPNLLGDGLRDLLDPRLRGMR